uniref:Uncharacterized protein n=1 Tax=Aliivibrio wodanis TaxID=80852 RepID=A0A5Q4ZUS2_9GAMM|nr:hypothetical protein AW0309160_01122 [Aliivibrio wodanis]
MPLLVKNRLHSSIFANYLCYGSFDNKESNERL